MAAMLDEAEQSRLLSYLASPYCTGVPADNECLRLMRYFFQPVEKDKPEAKDEESMHRAAFPGLPFYKQV